MQAIRPDDQGKVDDIAIDCTMFRMERMDTGRWWAAAYRGDKRVAFGIQRVGKDIEVTVVEDSIGCEDDRRQWEPTGE